MYCGPNIQWTSTIGCDVSIVRVRTRVLFMLIHVSVFSDARTTMDPFRDMSLDLVADTLKDCLEQCVSYKKTHSLVLQLCAPGGSG